MAGRRNSPAGAAEGGSRRAGRLRWRSCPNRRVRPGTRRRSNTHWSHRHRRRQGAVSNAEPVPFRRFAAAGPAGGQWAVQVGAFAAESQARLALGNAREHAHVELAVAHPYVASVHVSHGVLWRARLTGLSHEAAVQACEKLGRMRLGCVVLSPDSQL